MARKTLSQTLTDAAKDLHFEKATLARLESLNIPLVRKLTPRDIRAIRKKMNASQGVFAKYLNVATSTVQKWEQGSVKPQGVALKLLNLVNEKGVGLLMG